MTIDLGPSGILAKVTAISDEGNSVYFDLRNGKTGSLNNVDQEYLIGDVLLITGDIDNNRVEIDFGCFTGEMKVRRKAQTTGILPHRSCQPPSGVAFRVY